MRAQINLQAYNPKEATLAKVVPTPNNGFTELVKIHREKVSYLSFRAEFVQVDHEGICALFYIHVFYIIRTPAMAMKKYGSYFKK